MENTISLTQLSKIFLRDSWSISKLLKSHGINRVDKNKNGLIYDISVVQYLFKFYNKNLDMYLPVYITSTYYIFESKINKEENAEENDD